MAQFQVLSGIGIEISKYWGKPQSNSARIVSFYAEFESAISRILSGGLLTFTSGRFLWRRSFNSLVTYNAQNFLTSRNIMSFFFQRKNALRSVNKEVTWQLRRVTDSNSAGPRSLFLWVCPHVPGTDHISGCASIHIIFGDVYWAANWKGRARKLSRHCLRQAFYLDIGEIWTFYIRIVGDSSLLECCIVLTGK